MKKTLLAISLAFLALEAQDFKGIIESIDDANKTVIIHGTAVKVMPYTKIEQDSCGIGWDMMKKFADLKVNDIVELEVFYNGDQVVAKEIEIQCSKHRAY